MLLNEVTAGTFKDDGDLDAAEILISQLRKLLKHGRGFLRLNSWGEELIVTGLDVRVSAGGSHFLKVSFEPSKSFTATSQLISYSHLYSVWELKKKDSYYVLRKKHEAS